MEILNVSYVAGPDPAAAKPAGETGLVIDIRTLASKIGDDKLGIADLGYDFVRDVVVELLPIESNRPESGLFDCGGNSLLVGELDVEREPHGYETLTLPPFLRYERLNTVPSSKREGQLNFTCGCDSID
jgi:hypothetical protein